MILSMRQETRVCGAVVVVGSKTIRVAITNSYHLLRLPVCASVGDWLAWLR
jgi:hypothetical protein